MNYFIVLKYEEQEAYRRVANEVIPCLCEVLFLLRPWTSSSRYRRLVGHIVLGTCQHGWHSGTNI